MALKKLLAAGLASLVLVTNACYGDDTVVANPKAYPVENSVEDYILDKADGNQVVMFGEVHYYLDESEFPNLIHSYRKDNDFVISLLSELKDQGFNYLAIEIPRSASGVSFVDSIRSYASGSIIREEISPEDLYMSDIETAGWLDLIEVAKIVGMKVVPYDMVRYDKLEDISNLREATSFKNMKDLIFNADPKAKVAVYCGALHVNEKPYVVPVKNNGEVYDIEIRWLGQYLDEYTSGRNFTVSFSNNLGYVMPYADFEVIFDED